MSTTMTQMSVRTWFGDHDPTPTEIPNSGVVEIYDNYINYLNGSMFYCTDTTPNAYVWAPLANTSLAKGIASLVLGTATVSAPMVTADSRIFLGCYDVSGTAGAPFVSAINPGTGFNITSTSLSDTSKIAWEIKN